MSGDDPGSRKASTVAGRTRRSGRTAARAGWRICATRGGGAVRRARLADRPRRGVAVHERGADRRRSISGRPAPMSGSRPSRPGRVRCTPTRRCALVFVNGRFDPTLSRTKGLPAGVRVGSLAAALNDHADVVQRYLGQLAEFSSRALHRAQHGASCRTAPSSTSRTAWSLEQPIHLLFVSTASPTSATVMAHPRTLIVAGATQPGADRRELRRRRGRRPTSPTPCPRCSSARTPVVDHYKVQQESARRVPRRQHARAHRAQRDASRRTRSRSAASSCATTPARMLDGEGGDCTLNGLYLADGDRLVDNHTTIDHAKPHCGSHEVYKGILGGTARAVFNGKIIVRQDAQKTDAKQTNRALLLSDGATINTKPQLEIFADDVKCTHGAAIGQLDDDAIFYLRARGPDLLRGARHADPRVRRRHSRPASRSSRCASRSRPSCSRSWRKDLAEARRGMTPLALRPCARVGDRRRAATCARRLPDPVASVSTASRSSIWTTRPRRQKPRVGARGDGRATTGTINANVHRGVHELSERATDAVRGGARARPRVPQRARPADDRLHAQRHRRASTSWRRASAARRSGGRRDRHLRRWSTTRTSCRGSWSASRPARGCGSRRSTTAASRCSTTFDRAARRRGRGSWRSRTCRTRSGPINPVRDDRRAGARAWRGRC